MCTSWIDCINGIAHHLAQNIDVAIVAAADPATLRAHARNRGWNRLRLLSAGESTFKYDLGSEDREGNQDSTISVLTRDADGTLRHFYSVHPRLGEDIQERGIDEYNPVWNFLDLTPEGRGTFDASLDYGQRCTQLASSFEYCSNASTDCADYSDGSYIQRNRCDRWTVCLKSISFCNLL